VQERCHLNDERIRSGIDARLQHLEQAERSAVRRSLGRDPFGGLAAPRAPDSLGRDDLIREGLDGVADERASSREGQAGGDDLRRGKRSAVQAGVGASEQQLAGRTGETEGDVDDSLRWPTEVEAMRLAGGRVDEQALDPRRQRRGDRSELHGHERRREVRVLGPQGREPYAASGLEGAPATFPSLEHAHLPRAAPVSPPAEKTARTSPRPAAPAMADFSKTLERRSNRRGARAAREWKRVLSGSSNRGADAGDRDGERAAVVLRGEGMSA